jgi:hypothetical protein
MKNCGSKLRVYTMPQFHRYDMAVEIIEAVKG